MRVAGCDRSGLSAKKSVTNNLTWNLYDEIIFFNQEFAFYFAYHVYNCIFCICCVKIANLWFTIAWIVTSIQPGKRLVGVDQMQHENTERINSLCLLKHQSWICSAECWFVGPLLWLLPFIVEICLISILWPRYKTIHSIDRVNPIKFLPSSAVSKAS